MTEQCWHHDKAGYLFPSKYTVVRAQEMKSHENSYCMTFKCQSHTVDKHVFLKMFDQNSTRGLKHF